MSIRKPQPKMAVKLIRAVFDAALAGAKPLSTKDAYQLLAQLEGYKNWAHAKGDLAPRKEPVKLGYTVEETKEWTTFVIFMNFADVDCEETLYVMPPGSTFKNRSNPRHSWTPFNEEDSILLPPLFETLKSEVARNAKRMCSFVVKDVFSLIPRPDRYGIPAYANELGVKNWVLKELGWNYLCYDDGVVPNTSALDVNFTDSGDDSSGRYWMEVAVAPDVAALILSAFEHATPEDRYEG